MKYSNHQDSLIALVSHLGLTKHKSRTPLFISKNTGIPEDKVRKILAEFPGLFRKSRNISSKNENFYTLQIRYALRGSQYDEDTKEEEGTPLEITHIVSLLDFISNQAHQEQNINIANVQLEQTKELFLKELQLNKESMSQELTIAKSQINNSKRASIIAAVAAIISAIISAVVANNC
ncbi:hypothetical protein [Candidatus Thiosymbion oneisti]|uniref:hypothetical protein n=1 Tax=Candidatus Thiosymbion oneisti TaxID=589554 RepID=UPI0010609780|nr:hypothetical protein [Candidatus Thiosymbion oneisti]